MCSDLLSDTFNYNYYKIILYSILKTKKNFLDS
nr:MAG TPA: hypothetical protein [Caudoviricetes sp.]